MTGDFKVLVGTFKGAWTITGNSTRDQWQVEGPLHLGSKVYHYVADPRKPDSLLLTEGGGHLGPSIFRSIDGGETWTEATKPPQFPKADDDSARSVDHAFWLSPGHISQPGRWYAGTSPQALFKSKDGGETWDEMEGLN